MATNQYLENQAMQAQQNPTIISDLVSTPTPSAAQPNPVPQQGQQMAQDLSSKLYSTGYVSGGEQQNDALLQQLFQYDQMIENKQSPFPAVAGYVQNPADLTRAEAGYASGVGGLSASMGAATSDAERAYQSAIAGILDKFFSFAQMNEQKRQAEQARADEQAKFDYQKQQDSISTQLAIAKLMGGNVTLSDGSTVYIPPDTTSSMSVGERQQKELKDQVLADVQNGMIPKDLFTKYGSVADFNTLLNIYNANSGYGPAKETIQELRSMYDGTGNITPEDPTVKAYAEKVQSGEISLTNVPADGGVRNAVAVALQGMPLSNEEKTTVDGLSKNIADYQAQLNKKFGGIIPLTADKGKAQVSRDLISMQLARLFEKGRMSDQDRAFYTSLVPTPELAAIAPQKAAAQLQQIQDFINQKYSDQNTQDTSMIRVRLKSNGQTGSLPANEFDSSIYERL